MANSYINTDTHITDLKGRFVVSATPPANPVAGDMYFDTTQKGLFRYSGNNWLGFPFTQA